MIYVEILAGGKGTRLGNTEMPKQFLMLGDKPIIVHTIEQFLFNEDIDKILICCIEQWKAHMNSLLEHYFQEDSKDRIEVVIGGSDRNESIINGCRYIEAKYGVNADDIIITHDAVRPFLTYRIIKDNIEAAKENLAVDTTVLANDTIVRAKDGKYIDEIPVRNEMYLGQTPQTFNLKKLMEMYEALTNEEKEILTDACKMFLLKGEEVAMVKGEYYNIKITNAYDLKMANAIVRKGIQND